MRKILSIATLSLVLAVPAAAKTYGEPLPHGLAPVGVKAALGAGVEGTLAVTGRITQVCQKKGCWVVLAEDETMIRVMARDHGFFLPKDASGRAIAHGRIERKTLSAEQVEHMIEEDGADAGLRENPVEVRLVADGVELVDP